MTRRFSGGLVEQRTAYCQGNCQFVCIYSYTILALQCKLHLFVNASRSACNPAPRPLTRPLNAKPPHAAPRSQNRRFATNQMARLGVVISAAANRRPGVGSVTSQITQRNVQIRVKKVAMGPRPTEENRPIIGHWATETETSQQQCDTTLR